VAQQWGIKKFRNLLKQLLQMYSEFGPQRVSSSLASCAEGEYYRLGAGCTKKQTCPDGEYFDLMEARCAKKNANLAYTPRYTRTDLVSAEGQLLAGQGQFIPVISSASRQPMLDARRRRAAPVRRRAAPVRRRAAPVRYVVVKRKPAARKRVVKKRKAVRRRR
jgi:hypothetical protein